MQIYPGVAQLTVSTSGAGPGMIITSGSGDPHGWWPVPLVAQGNDARSAANTMAAVQAVTDRTNWIGWRAIDWIFGGDYRVLFRGSLLVGNSIAIDRSYAADMQSCLILTGPTGAGARTLDVSGGGTTGVAARFTGAASATVAVAILGGSTTGDGLLVTAQNGNSTAITGNGHGSGSGLVGTAGATTGTPAVRALSGPLLVDTNVASSSTPTGVNMMWGDMIPKAGGSVSTSGTSSVSVLGGYNFTASIVLGSIQINFATAMADVNYAVMMSMAIINGHEYQTRTNNKATTHFAIVITESGSPLDINGLALPWIDFVVTGRQ